MDRNVRAGYGKHLLCYCRIIIEHHQSVNVVPALHVRVHKAPLNTKCHFYTTYRNTRVNMATMDRYLKPVILTDTTTFTADLFPGLPLGDHLQSN